MLRPAGIFLAVLAVVSLAKAQENRPEKSVVFVAANSSSIVEFVPDAPAVASMVDALMANLTGKPDMAEAWRTLVSPADRIGIKISAAGGQPFSTHRAIVDAVASGLVKAGVSAKNIVVWDRTDPTEAGYRSGPLYQVRGIDPVYGYDPKQVFSAPLMGKLIWGDVEFKGKRDPLAKDAPEQISNESHLARLLGTVTKIINIPVMAANEGCGVAGALYNATIPNIDNWRRLATPNGADPYLNELYADERIGKKVVLHIMDGLIAQYAGGPEFQPNYAFHHGTIYAGKDPVALDANALREIDKWRVQAQLPPIAAQAGYVRSAEAMGMGNFAPEQIDLRAAVRR